MDKNINTSSSLIPGLDILKFAMALLVVAIHAEAVNDISGIYEVTLPLISCAVPVFFVISAYLVFRKIRVESVTSPYRSLIHFTKRLALLYIFWMVVQLPLVLHTRHYMEMNLFGFIYNFILDITLRSTFHGAWFLSALVVGVWMIYVSSKVAGDKIIWIVPFLLAMYVYHANKLPIEYQEIWNWYNNHIGNPQNSFTVSLFWISLGYITANPKLKGIIAKLKTVYVLMVLLTAWVFCIWGVDLRFLMVISLFVVSFNLKTEYKPAYKIMRQSSILIFILHFIFIGIFRLALPNVDCLQHGLILYGVLIVLCLLSSIIILKLKDYKYFSWLKYSY